MVRKCAVKNCNSTDINIISHRFPRSEKSAATWRDALDINDIPLSTLISKFVVCTLHFARTDYRNAQSNFLNSTAIPKKPEADPQTPEKYSVMGMLGDYYGKPMSTYRKDRNSSQVKPQKTIMVYEISEIENIETLQEPEHGPENEFVDINDDDDDEQTAIEVIEESEDETHDSEIGIEEYIPQQKKHKFDSDTTYVRLDNNVVVALSEQEEEDEESYEVQEDPDLNYNDENNTENDSIDLLFLEKDSGDENIIDEDSGQINQATIKGKVTPKSEIADELLNEEINEELQENLAEPYYDEGEYATCTRKDLIEKLIQSTTKIQELETKLETIQSAQTDMVKSIENFKKIFNS